MSWNKTCVKVGTPEVKPNISREYQTVRSSNGTINKTDNFYSPDELNGTDSSVKVLREV